MLINVKDKNKITMLEFRKESWKIYINKESHAAGKLIFLGIAFLSIN